LDRGAAATASDLRDVEAAVTALTALDASASLPSAAFGETLLSGLWRLVFSSAFSAASATGSQGFTGPPGGSSARLLAVRQKVGWRTRTLQNVVELRLAPPLPGLPSLTLAASLGHTLLPTAGAPAAFPRAARLVFTGLTLRVRGAKGLRPLALPSPAAALAAAGVDVTALLPPALTGGEFESVFTDGELRVARGDRGELRVFLRE